MKRSLPFAMIVIVLTAGLVLWLYLKRSVNGNGASTFAASTRPDSPDPSPFVSDSGAEPAHARGPATATVMLEEFADFECLACGKLYPILKSIEAQYGTRVRVIFREFPLAQHLHAMPAGRAAEAAGMQGKFWEMHDMLYENRETWTKAPDVQTVFEDYARKLGLDLEQFKRDQTSQAIHTRIAEDRHRGLSLKLRGTPAVYLNGVEIPFDQMTTIEAMRSVINVALKPAAS